MAGLTPDGLTILRLPEVVDELKDKAREIWADTVPEGEAVNVDDNSAIGRQIGVVAPSGADLWEAIQEVYDAFNPNTAVGVALDNIVALGGVTRIPASPTRATCLLTGSTGVVIPAGSKVSSSVSPIVYSLTSIYQLSPQNARGVGVVVPVVANNTVYTINYKKSTQVNPVVVSITTPSSGNTVLSIFGQFQASIASAHPELQTRITGSVLTVESVDPFQLFSFTSSNNLSISKCSIPALVVADVVGPNEQPSNTITNIATPILGWDSVTNPSDGAIGSFIETDSELRERFRNTKFDKATNIIESLYSAILSVQGVEDIRIYENDTNITDSNGVDGHSFLTIVDGGLGSAIAQAIWDNKPIGIQSQGNTVVTVLDSQGLPHDVRFSRPTQVTVFVQIALTKFSDFPADGEDKIKDAIISYLNTLRIGESVTYSRLYTPINSIPGHQVDSLFIGTTSSPTGTSNISINFDELAVTSNSSITFV
jgi:uncharacterized phage protein gp47/JayE